MAQKKQLTQFYNAELKQKFDVLMAGTKTLLTIVMYAFGFIVLNLADLVAGGATMSKGLVSATGPAMGWTLALIFSGAFGFIQLIMWNRIMDKVYNKQKWDIGTYGIVFLAIVIAVVDTIIDVLSIPLWLATSPLESVLGTMYIGTLNAYDMFYYSLLIGVLIVTMFGELFVILYLNSTDEAIYKQSVTPLPSNVMRTKEQKQKTHQEKLSKNPTLQAVYASQNIKGKASQKVSPNLPLDVHPNLSDLDFN